MLTQNLMENKPSFDLHRVYDARLLNVVVNHASVKPHVSLGYEGQLDLTRLCENVRNIVLVNDFGGFIYVQLEDHNYEVHTQFLPEGRGEHAVKAARESLDYVFAHDAYGVVTFVPLGNTAAERLAKSVGFNYAMGSIMHGKPGKIYVIRREDRCQ